MNARSNFPLVSLGFLVWAGLPLAAREPAREVADLTRLEAKVEAVVPKVLPATVALLSTRTASSGSGVIVAEDGLILTAAHVVEGTAELLVVFPNGKQVQGKVLGANFSKDIAMVKITEAGKWPCVAMGTSKPLAAGDWVIALGHSAGFDAGRTPPVRFGRVMSKGPLNFLTTDCTLIGGDSGGPLFDLDGKIVGIHSSIGTPLTTNNHAGIDGFREDWDRLLAGETWGELSMNPFANPEMPVLGIIMGKTRGDKGVLVMRMIPGSPAAAAGARTGDVIHSIDGSEVRNDRDMLLTLARHKAGEQVKLGILRDTEALEINVKLKRRSDLFENR